MSARARVLALLYATRERLRALLRGERLDRELDEELAFHLEQATAANRRRGMSPAAARAAAARALGSASRVRVEERRARGIGLLDEVPRDAVYALRMFRSWPLTATVVVVTLAAGIGAVTTIWAAVEGLVLDPLPYPDVDRLVVVGDSDGAGGFDARGGEAWVHGDDVGPIRGIEVFESTAVMRLLMVVMTGAHEPVEAVAYETSPQFFAMLGAPAAVGTSTLSTDGAAGEAVVLADRFWRSHLGGDPNALGRSVRLGERLGTIVGVMPAGAEYPLGTDFWIGTHPETATDTGRQARVVARLADGVSIERANAALAALGRRLVAEDGDRHAGPGHVAQRLRQNVTWGTRPMMAFLLGSAAFLLAIVCANVASLLMSVGSRRRPEFALRLALGAHRVRIVRQLLTEGLVLAGLGAAGGLAAAWVGAGVLRRALTTERLRFYVGTAPEITLDPTVLAFAVLLTGVTALVFGTLPALRTSRVELTTAMVGLSSSHGRPRSRVRSAMVLGEVALTILLTCGALTLVRGGRAISRPELGYDASTLTVTARLRGAAGSDPAAIAAFVDGSLERLRATPGLESAAVASELPGPPDPRSRVWFEPAAGGPAESSPASRVAASDGYFRTLEIPLLAGRAFTPDDDGSAPPVAVVGRALADRAWPGGDPIGRRIRTVEDGPWLTVVGMAGDVARAGNDARPALAVYRPWSQEPGTSVRFLVDSRTGTAALPDVRAAIRATAPEQPLSGPPTLEAAFAERVAPLRLMAGLVTAFAGLGLVLALSGVYALISRDATARTPEVGVRLALGARPADIRRAFATRGIRLALLGTTFGLGAAWAIASGPGRALERFVPTGDGTVPALLAAAAFVIVAGIASWLPARRAAATDPVRTLRAG